MPKLWEQHHRWGAAKHIGLDVNVAGFYCSAANTVCSVTAPYVLLLGFRRKK